MNIYGYFAGGTDLANTGIVSNANFLLWLTAYSQAHIVNDGYTCSVDYRQDSAATWTPGKYIQVRTPVRVTLPSNVSGVQGILQTEELYTDDDFTNIITSEDKGYAVKGDTIYVVSEQRHGGDLESIKEFDLTDGVLLLMGVSSSTQSPSYTPFSGNKAINYYNKQAIISKRKETIAQSMAKHMVAPPPIN